MIFSLLLLFVCLFVGKILFVCTRIRERHGVFPANKIYTKPTNMSLYDAVPCNSKVVKSTDT